MLRLAAVLLDEFQDVLEPGDDAPFAGRAPLQLLGVDLDAKLGQQQLVIAQVSATLGLRSLAGEERDSLGHAFFPRVGRQNTRQLAMLFLELDARWASSRASSSVKLTRLAAMVAATCLSVPSSMALARIEYAASNGLIESMRSMSSSRTSIAKLAHAVEQRGVGLQLSILAALKVHGGDRQRLGLLGQREGCDGVLTDGS